MKTTILVVIALVISTIVLSHSNEIVQEPDKKINAVYNGINDDGQFEFIYSKEEFILFDEVSDDVIIDLFDDENIGIEYSITWEEEEVEIYDEEDESTGDYEIIKTITELIEI